MMRKLSILKQFLAIGALLFLVTSCEKDEIEIDDSAQQLTEDFDTKVSVPSYEVATIQKDGHEYQFVAVGEEGEMVILEKLYGSAEENFEESGIAEDDTPYELFLSLTDDNVKVPFRLAATVDESVIEASNREINESSSLLEILDPNYSESNVEDRACNDIGYTNFRNTYCGGTSNSNSDIRHCDANLSASWHYRTSNGYSHKKVRTWTMVCGTVKIRIGDDNGGHFPTWIYQRNISNGIWWVNWFPNTLKRREVHRLPYSGATFRAYTRFSN